MVGPPENDNCARDRRCGLQGPHHAGSGPVGVRARDRACLRAGPPWPSRGAASANRCQIVNNLSN